MTISKFIFNSFLYLDSLLLIFLIGLELMFWYEKFMQFIHDPITKGVLVLLLLHAGLALSRES